MIIFRREVCFFDFFVGFWCIFYREKFLMFLRVCMNLYFYIILGMLLILESLEGNIYLVGLKFLGIIKENIEENLLLIIKYSIL